MTFEARQHRQLERCAYIRNRYPNTLLRIEPCAAAPELFFVWRTKSKERKLMPYSQALEFARECQRMERRARKGKRS